MITYFYGIYTMENGIDSSDVIMNRGLNGFYGAGFGMMGGGYGNGYGSNYGGQSLPTREAYDGTVDNANILANRAIMGGAISSSERSGIASVQALDDKFETTNRDRQFAEIRLAIADGKAESAKCCCETQKLVAENRAEFTKLILEQSLETAKQAGDIARQDCQTNTLLQAINGIGPQVANALAPLFSNGNGGNGKGK